MEDAHKYLMSEKQRKDVYYSMRILKEDIKRWTGEHALISKYRERLWFQRIMHQSKEELLGRYYFLAKMIEDTEASVANIERQLYLHNCAVEELHGSMKPFDGLNMGSISLQQMKLF